MHLVSPSPLWCRHTLGDIAGNWSCFVFPCDHCMSQRDTLRERPFQTGRNDPPGKSLGWKFVSDRRILQGTGRKQRIRCHQRNIQPGMELGKWFHTPSCNPLHLTHHAACGCWGLWSSSGSNDPQDTHPLAFRCTHRSRGGWYTGHLRSPVGSNIQGRSVRLPWSLQRHRSSILECRGGTQCSQLRRCPNLAGTFHGGRGMRCWTWSLQGRNILLDICPQSPPELRRHQSQCTRHHHTSNHRNTNQRRCIVLRSGRKALEDTIDSR